MGDEKPAWAGSGGQRGCADLELSRRRDYKPVTVTTDMPTLLKAAIDQNFVPVVDDRNVFIGMVRRTVLLRELYDKYTTLPPDKRFQSSHPPM